MIRYPTHEIEDSERDEEAQEEQEEAEVIRNPTTGKFHCVRCVFATTHGPTLQVRLFLCSFGVQTEVTNSGGGDMDTPQVHARRQCKLLGGLLPKGRVATQKSRSQRGLSFSPSISTPLTLPCPILDDVFFSIGASPRFIDEKRLSPRLEMSPTSSVEARGISLQLRALRI